MYQKTIIVGNLGRDPEMRYMPDGTAVTSFSVATSRTWNDRNGQKQTETTWFRVSAWGRMGETANQYLTKGSKVLVEGTLTPDRETGGPKVWMKQDGKAGASFELRADVVRFLSSRGEVPESENGSYQPQTQQEDDIPF